MATSLALSSLNSRWRTLHRDLLDELPSLLARVSLVEPCLDVVTRTGDATQLLKDGGCSRVWQADTSILEPTTQPNPRRLLGALEWMHMHPRLMHDVPNGFGLVVSVWGTWRVTDDAHKVATSLAALLAPGGCAALCEPTELATPQPTVLGYPSDDATLTVMVQDVDGRRIETRVVDGHRPMISEGPNLDAEGWSDALRNAGLDVTTHRLGPLRSLLCARKTSQHS